jgi:hypothetical protein
MLPPFSILKMEAMCSSRMLGVLPQTAQCHNPEDHNINNHHSENFKTYIEMELDALDCENINWIELANDWVQW